MKIAVVAAIVCASARAYAGPPTFDSVKLVSERPAVHKAADVHKALKPLRSSLVACGTPRIDPRLSATLTANLELKIGGDGAVGDVTLDSKTLGEDTVDCIATAMRTVKLPAKKKPSVVRLVLVYKRK
ncbi:MAG TPA: hypothetical protein VIV11_30770 [Kofleriaceae bacterium]